MEQIRKSNLRVTYMKFLQLHVDNFMFQKPVERNVSLLTVKTNASHTNK